MNIFKFMKVKLLVMTLIGISASFLISSGTANAQIWEPEGLNLPGLWNGWTNPPVNNLALASFTQVPGGKVTKITTGTVRWQTIVKVAASGGDVIGGSYPFLFTSGATATPWQNTWKDVTVIMNTLQDYTYNGTNDDQVTVNNGFWYTINWKDNGYSPSKAIFMETAGNPVSINTVTQSPLPGSVSPGQDVTVTLTLSSNASPQELFYVRYSNNGFTTSSLVPVTVAGTTGTAVIPATTGNVTYYAFSTTVANPTSEYYMYAIKVNDNSGSNYSFSYNTSNVNVTFKVDMSLQTVSPDGVHLVGDFQGWNAATTPMASVGGGIYSVTLPIQSGGYQEYKFVNGNTFTGAEAVPAACGTDNGSGGYNRYFTVPSVDTVFDPICFSSCVVCSSMVPVIFKVDMGQQTVSSAGVHLAGDFQGWNPSGTTMTLASGSIYSATVYLEDNSYHEYKFVNGDAWGNEEQVPADCGVDNGSGGFNRFLTVSSANPVLPAVCFSSCTTCGESVPVTFWVDMSQQVVSSNGVHLVGNFQGWDPVATPMELTTESVYTATVSLPENTTYEFKYVNGDSWDGAEIVPEACGVDNGSGGFNRYLELGTVGIYVPEVCFSSCDDCPPPVPTIDVTFRVNLSNETVSPDGIHLVGDFQGWDTETTEMISTGNGIYSIVVALAENSTHQYKFINGNAWEGEEIVPAECGVDNGTGGYNREIVLGTSDTLLMAVCFSSCEPCPTPPSTSLVTFRIDMQTQVVSLDGVHLTGNFQEWDPAATPMVNLSGTIYEASVLLDEGYSVEFKYVNGIVWPNAESVPSACGVDDGNGGFNRYFTVPLDDTVTVAVCFNTCEICHVGWEETLNKVPAVGNPVPNPCETNLAVSYQVQQVSKLFARIYDCNGKEILASSIYELNKGKNTITYDVNNLPSGIYSLVSFIDEGGRMTRTSTTFVKK
jgi:hypothetical protein